MAVVHPRLIVPGSDGVHDDPVFTSDILPLSPHGANMIALSVVLLFLTGLWTLMRVWCRRQTRAPFGPEDYLYFIALFFFLGQVADNYVAIAIGGSGHHIWQLQPYHVVRLLQSIFALQVLYALAVGFVKISITVMFMRIFPSRKFRFACIGAITLSTAWILMTILAGLLVCNPPEKNWNPDAPGYCGNQTAAFVAVGVVDVLNEICLLVLPLPMLFKLHLSQRYRVALSCVFSTGVITMIVSIVRIPLLIQTNFADLSYDNRSQLIALAEPAVGLIVSSSPLLKPVFDRFLAPFLPARQTDESSKGKNGLAMETIGGSGRGMGFTKLSDFEENLELGNVTHSHATESSARVGQLAGAVSLHPQSDDDSRAILVVKETIVTRES